jgi:hypothetical protein
VLDIGPLGMSGHACVSLDSLALALVGRVMVEFVIESTVILPLHLP